MFYAGIDEAGYGPMYGPLTVGSCLFQVPDAPCDMWQKCGDALAKTRKGSKGRVVIADSKKLKTSDGSCRLLADGVAAFLRSKDPECVLQKDTQWFRQLSAPDSPISSALPWYQQSQPLVADEDEDMLRIRYAMLRNVMAEQGVLFRGLRVRMLDEQQFNNQVELTRNKASVSFSLVATHLWNMWNAVGEEPLYVVIDRQGGRTRYRQILSQVFPDAQVAVIAEDASGSRYELCEGKRCLNVEVRTKAESAHLPVALASMAAKLVRESMMLRFNLWFAERVEGVAPTAGYGSDANRWRDQIMPQLSRIGVDHATLRRVL